MYYFWKRATRFIYLVLVGIAKALSAHVAVVRFQFQMNTVYVFLKRGGAKDGRNVSEREGRVKFGDQTFQIGQVVFHKPVCNLDQHDS